jgi:CBS domain-containing protein
MKVGDVLRNRKGTRIATVRMNETVATAARLLRAEDLGALVVKDVCRTEGNVAIGMFSEADVARAIAGHGTAGYALKVSALISVQQLVSCSPADTLEHVRQLMDQHHIRHLPVIDDTTLVGVISIQDVDHALNDAETALPAFAAEAIAHPASPHL